MFQTIFLNVKENETQPPTKIKYKLSLPYTVQKRVCSFQFKMEQTKQISMLMHCFNFSSSETIQKSL